MNSQGLIGQKIGMTTIFVDDGRAVPVTVVKTGPCPVIQVKDEARDGYQALQLGFEQLPERKVNKPQQGHQSKAGKGYFRKLVEFRQADNKEHEVGQELDCELFHVGERVKITGTSKGKGFAGVMKRWNFGGSPSSHGHHKVHRAPGAIGQCAYPAKVFKGKKMPGQMGNKRVTIPNAEIVDIRKEDNLILLRGQVPGAKNSLIMICKKG
ncbi:MAG: 50S ribosomal protein L3 [Desulfohalobiaceae bacterium]|nr:50S ribosomal protein L3 [Desulfohalobiaceae bacterium]